MDALGGVARREEHAFQSGDGADYGFGVGAERPRAGKLLDQFGPLQVRKHVDGALQQLQPGGFRGLPVELLAEEKLPPVVVASAGAANAEEAVGPAYHVAALGGAYQHFQGFAGVVQQEPFALHRTNRDGEVEPGGESVAPGASGHDHRGAV